MKRPISFKFQGKQYKVGMEAYDKDLPIKLPDGRVLRVAGGWFESLPPQPDKLEVIDLPVGKEFIEAIEDYQYHLE